jgi:hypothetical protein
MFRYLSRLTLVVVLAVVFGTGTESDGAKAGRSQRTKNEQRSATARTKALDRAISAGKMRLQRAQAVANAASQRYFSLQANANSSAQRKLMARVELIDAGQVQDSSSHELNELRAKIEKFEPDDSPLRQARAEYDAAREELAQIRLDIFESDKYLSLYEGAMRLPNKAKELERLTQVCFEEDDDYQAAKRRVEVAKMDYDRIRHALYEEHPDWAAAAERAKAATAAENRAATTFKATAVESGIEGINAREAYKNYAATQASLADAKQDLKRLEAQKKKLGKPRSTGKDYFFLAS